MIGVLAIDRAGPADAGAEDETIGDLENLDDDGEETTPPVGFVAAGVGYIGSTVDGADDAVVGDAGAAAGDTGESLAAMVGFETAAADSVARGLPTEVSPSTDSEAGGLAKAEFRSAVIRSYIRLGLVVAGREDALSPDVDEADTDTAESETSVVVLAGATTADCRVVEDETGLPAIVAADVYRDGIVAAAGLVETLEVGFWTLVAVCPLLNPYVPPWVVGGE
jgi:hypothetical protein